MNRSAAALLLLLPLVWPGPALQAQTPMSVHSTAFQDGQPIPRQYTGDSSDASPPLAIDGVPDKARSLVVTCVDPDAPGTLPFIHWLLYNVDPHVHALPEGVAPQDSPANLPGSHQLHNGFDQVGYNGPAPPSGKIHHYIFTVYALDAVLPDKLKTNEELTIDMRGHVLASARTTGTYHR